MPEMRFHVRWPDGDEVVCYSPSLVIQDYLSLDEDYTVNEFVTRCSTALNEASERVKSKYGFYCSSAMDQLSAIRHKAEKFSGNPELRVKVEKFTPGNR